MDQNELNVRNALAALAQSLSAALEKIGKNPADDPLIDAAQKALAVPGGVDEDYRHLLLGISEASYAVSKLSELAIRGLNDDSRGKIGLAVGDLKKAAKRLANIGSGKAFDWQNYLDEQETEKALHYRNQTFPVALHLAATRGLDWLRRWWNGDKSAIAEVATLLATQVKTPKTFE